MTFMSFPHTANFAFAHVFHCPKKQTTRTLVCHSNFDSTVIHVTRKAIYLYTNAANVIYIYILRVAIESAASNLCVN